MPVDIDVRVNMDVTLLGARGRAALDRFHEEAVDEVSAQLLADWHGFLDRSIRHPTPYYETQLTVRPVADTIASVSDRGVVYGPWLEGTSERNRTTRFKGYSALRRARQATVRRIPQLIAGPRARLIAALSGR
jgi:hypothetical protein